MDKIKKIKKSKKMMGFFLALILLAVAAGVYLMQSSGALTVESAVIEKDTVGKLIKETGTVESEISSVITAKAVTEIKSFDFQEGAAVKAGQVILKTDVTAAQLTVKSMESEAAALRIQYNRAKDDLAQNRILFDQGAISQDTYQQIAAIERQLAAQLNAMVYSVASMKENLDTGGITSPIDGVITQIYVKSGETVQPGSQIMEISDLSSLYISVNLIAEDADQIEVGSKALVYNEDAGFRDEKAFVRKIHLKAFDLVSDLGISQKRVKIEVELGPGGKLRLGNNMDVEITADTRENVLALPKKAVFELDQKDYVFVIENSIAVLKPVELGLKGEESWEVLSGLEEGDVVIISPGNDIEEGVRVK